MITGETHRFPGKKFLCPCQSFEDMERICNEIESVLYNSLEKEITTTYIGDLVMEKLKKLDDVAYVRFASVHRQFKDINSLYDEVTKLLNK